MENLPALLLMQDRVFYHMIFYHSHQLQVPFTIADGYKQQEKHMLCHDLYPLFYVNSFS